MKILQVIDSLHYGGAERLMVDTVPYMENEGVRVDVALLNGEETDFHKELRANAQGHIYSLGKGYYDLRYFYKFYKLCKSYDVIHVHLFPAQYYIAILKMFKLVQCDVFFTEHSTSNRRIKSGFIRLFERVIYKQFKLVICITEEVRKVLLEYNLVASERTRVISNGVNLEKIDLAHPYDRKDFGYSEEDVLVCMVAAFRREKDQDTLIESLTLLPDCYKLILVGDGERGELLKKLAQQLGVSDRVFFAGIRNDVFNIVKMCNLSVLSSHWEGFGLVAVEAMHCGTPLIASNVAGLSQVVGQGGMLFESGNVSELAEKILLVDTDLALSDALVKMGRERAKHFDIKKMVNSIVKEYL